MADEHKPPLKRETKFDLLYFVTMIFAVVLIRDLWVSQNHVKTIP